MASVAPEVVVAGTVVAAPPDGDVFVGTVIGATGHPALLALPPGVEYVRAASPADWAPLLPTDPVVDVFALDRSLFDAANAAKRRVHLCNGAPGTLDMDQSSFNLLRGIDGAIRPAMDGALYLVLSHMVGTPDLQPLLLPAQGHGISALGGPRPDCDGEGRSRPEGHAARQNAGGASQKYICAV